MTSLIMCVLSLIQGIKLRLISCVRLLLSKMFTFALEFMVPTLNSSNRMKREYGVNP